jgi:hypothetical protein
MKPLSSYSNYFINNNPEAAENKSQKEFNEDDERRCIRKVLHKIRNARMKSEKIDLSLSYYAISAYQFDLLGKTIEKITLQMTGNNYLDISVKDFKRVEDYNILTGKTMVGLKFDNRMTLYFYKTDDQQQVIDYINGQGIEDFIPAFGKFNESTINAEITSRKGVGCAIRQTPTPLCGPANIAYLAAKYKGDLYQKTIKELYNYAECYVGEQNYLIKPRNSFTGQNYHADPSDIRGMAQADYILLTSIQTAFNDFLSYDGLLNGGGITMPSQMVTLITKMLNAKECHDHTNSIVDQDISLANDLNSDYDNGYICLMLLDADMLDGDTYSMSATHWITLTSKIDIDQEKSTVKFTAFSWGNCAYEFSTTINSFENTFYGYIKVKF